MNSAATSRKTLLTAAWLAPMDQPILRDGGVVFANGMIIAVGEAKTLRAAHPDAAVNDLGASIILPGLVNPHTHLELSSCGSEEAPSSFVDWILSMPRRIGRQPNQRADDLFASATRGGIEQCIRFGVTCVGDISQQMHVTRSILRDSPLRAVSYGEVIGLGKRRTRFEELLPLALDESAASERLRIGLTPHSPYTVEPDAMRRCVEFARTRRLPLATHLAETPDEREFLRDHAGPLREMWERLGSWEDFAETFDGSAVAFAQSIGLLDYPTLLAHVNYCDDRELDLLARGQASVVYCPRTHRFFGHPPHRWREMLARGINVAVGTDSCASSPNLNLVDDLRLMRESAPDFPAEQLWELATTRAAKAIEMDDVVGSLTPGKAADFVTFEVKTNDPLAEVLAQSRLPGEVWIGGAKGTRPASPC
jgi:cytosine/adenosine deaminase-related metal-dependent hydrolase